MTVPKAVVMALSAWW